MARSTNGLGAARPRCVRDTLDQTHGMKGRGSDKRAAAVAGPQGGRVASLAGAEGVRGDPEVRQAAARGASYEGGALNACGNPQLTGTQCRRVFAVSGFGHTRRMQKR
jgi:hypothetical protein